MCVCMWLLWVSPPVNVNRWESLAFVRMDFSRYMCGGQGSGWISYQWMIVTVDDGREVSKLPLVTWGNGWISLSQRTLKKVTYLYIYFSLAWQVSLLRYVCLPCLPSNFCHGDVKRERRIWDLLCHILCSFCSPFYLFFSQLFLWYSASLCFVLVFRICLTRFFSLRCKESRIWSLLCHILWFLSFLLFLSQSYLWCFVSLSFLSFLYIPFKFYHADVKKSEYDTSFCHIYVC